MIQVLKTNALPIVLNFSSVIDTNTMNVISSDVEINKYEHLGVNSDYLVNALKQLDMSLFLGFFKQLKEEVKII